MNKQFNYSSAVKSALKQSSPTVALESTVITHGLPYPQNFETLSHLENTILEEGATPATIVLIDGVVHIGLDEEDKKLLESRLNDPLEQVQKLSMRDLALAMAHRKTGGTTVSATMLLASLAGIEVFATGGIGGVHRDWQTSGDVSMDILALAQIPVTVVSAGCKAILDVSATVEMLESYGVPVLGWQTEIFPTFYSRNSNISIDSTASIEDFVRFHRYHKKLRTSKCGILIANPIPEVSEIPAKKIEPFIQAALQAAGEKGVNGKAMTPFLLDYLARSTAGESVEANLALLENNARLAAKLAIALKGV